MIVQTGRNGNFAAMGQVEALGEKFAALRVKDDDEADFQLLKRRGGEFSLDVARPLTPGEFIGQVPATVFAGGLIERAQFVGQSAGGALDVSSGEILFQDGEAAHKHDAREHKKTADQAKHGNPDDQQSLPPKGGRHTQLCYVEGSQDKPQVQLYRLQGPVGFWGVLVVHALRAMGREGNESVVTGCRVGLCSIHLAGREWASLLFNVYLSKLKGQMRKRRFYLQLALLLFVAAGCVLSAAAQDAGPMPPAPASQPATQKAPAPPSAAPAPDEAPAPSGTAAAGSAAPAAHDATSTLAVIPATAKIVVPAGTHIPLVLHNAITTRSARPGDPVYFETLFPVMIDGKVVIPAGSYVSGEVTESKRPGRVKGRGELMIKLTTMILPNAYMVNLNAVPSNAGTGGNETTDSEGKIIADSEKGHDVGTVAKTTAAGAGIGGLASQTGRGVGIGAAAGAAIGLAAVLLTRGPDAEMPRGSTVEAVIDRSLYLDADKVQFTGPGQASSLAGPPNREPVRNKDPF